MEKIDILIWVIGVGFTLNFGIMMMMWKGLNDRMDRLEDRMDRIEARIEKLDEKMTDIDRRLCRLEGAFASKDCCMIKDHGSKSEAMQERKIS